MYEGRSVAVIIPAHNEAAHVGDVIGTVPGFVDRIYAVDDGSDDGTWQAIRRATARENPQGGGRSTPRRVVPVRHETNRGAGGAVITGYRQAFTDGLDVIAVMDGDGQMDPDELDRIVAPVAAGDVDYAKGNRLHAPADRAMMSRWRLFGNAVLTILTRAASGYWEMADPQNGYTAISREALGEIPIDRLYTDYGFLNDVLVHLNRNRAKIADVAHRGVYGDESSGIRYRRFVPGLSALLARRFLGRLSRTYLSRRTHPFVACYVAGALGVGAGAAGLVAGVAGLADTPALIAMTGFGVALLGVTLLSLGIAYDVEHNRGLVERYNRPSLESRPGEPFPEHSTELASDGGAPGTDIDDGGSE